MGDHPLSRTLPRKGKVHGRSRSRTKQPGGLRTEYRLCRGPLAGLRLTKDPKDPVFPRVWVLCQDDLILATFRGFPEALWKKLGAPHRQEMKRIFVPVPEERQLLRRVLDDEAYRSMEFWERVAKHGRKKHSRLRIEINEDEVAEHNQRCKEYGSWGIYGRKNQK